MLVFVVVNIIYVNVRLFIDCLCRCLHCLCRALESMSTRAKDTDDESPEDIETAEEQVHRYSNNAFQVIPSLLLLRMDNVHMVPCFLEFLEYYY